MLKSHHKTNRQQTHTHKHSKSKGTHCAQVVATYLFFFLRWCSNVKLHSEKMLCLFSCSLSGFVLFANKQNGFIYVLVLFATFIFPFQFHARTRKVDAASQWVSEPSQVAIEWPRQWIRWWRSVCVTRLFYVNDNDYRFKNVYENHEKQKQTFNLNRLHCFQSVRSSRKSSHYKNCSYLLALILMENDTYLNVAPSRQIKQNWKMKNK